MSWWTYVPAALTAANSVYNMYQTKAGGTASSKWNTYNAITNFNVAVDNINAQNALARHNARAIMAADKASGKLRMATAELNATIIEDVTAYKDKLIDEELALMWEASDLDQELLANQRAVERGDIVANQAASGTIIGEGSNASVVMDQMTQEAMDLTVVRHNADIAAAEINNKKATNLWEGSMEASKIRWEGQAGALISSYNAAVQASSIVTEAKISGNANKRSAGFALQSGLLGSNNIKNSADANASNNLTNGLFGATSQAVGAYAENKGSLLTE